MAICAISLRRSCLPPSSLAVDAHLGVLAGEAARRGLAAGVGINLGVEHEHLDVHAAGQQPRERLEADVEHGAVAAHAPEGAVLPAHLVPSHPHPDGVGRRILEERVGPGNEVRIVRISRGVDGIAPRGGDDSPLVAVLRAGCRAHHPQGRALAAPRARAGATCIDVGLLLEHHVDQQVVVDVLLVARAEVLEIAMALARGGHDLVGLVGHLQGVVIADRDALGAPLALAGVDDDVEHAPRTIPSSWGRRSTSWFATTGCGTSRGRPVRRSSSTRSSSSVSESTLPRIAVSGHWVTQSMQPVQFSGM